MYIYENYITKPYIMRISFFQPITCLRFVFVWKFTNSNNINWEFSPYKNYFSFMGRTLPKDIYNQIIPI